MSNPIKQPPSQPPKTTNPTQPPQSQFKLIQTSTPLSALPNLTTTSTPTNTTKTTINLLLHATNTFGTWGAGFAKALDTLYPRASLIYKSYCDERRPSPTEWPSRELVGRCLVVPPQEGDVNAGGGRLWIGCLFTSYGYGSRAVRGGRGGGHAGKDAVGRVVGSTREALGEVRGWVRGSEEGSIGEGGQDGKSQKGTSKVVIYSPKFNSGNFGVDWEVTAAMIRDIFADWDGEWRILGDP